MIRIVRLMKDQLEKTDDITEKVDLLNRMSFELRDDDMEDSIKYADEARRLALQYPGTYKKGFALATVYLAQRNILRGDIQKGFNEIYEAMEMFREINDTEGIGFSTIMLSFYHWSIGEQQKALDFAVKGFKVHEAEGISNWARGRFNLFLGVFHSDLGNLDISLNHFDRAEKLMLNTDYPEGLGKVYNGLALALQRKGNLEKSLEYSNKALEITLEVGSLMGAARAYNDMGSVYTRLGEFKLAEQNLIDSLEIRRKSGNVHAIITTLTELAQVCINTAQFKKAEDYLNEAKQICDDKRIKNKVGRILLLYIELYKKTGDHLLIIEYYDQLLKLNTETAKMDMQTKISMVESKLAAETKAKEAEIFKLRNVELKAAYEQIEESNKEIRDSINYAKRIQQALLPKDQLIQKLCADHFIFYRPKDIISGDFYWIGEVENKIIIAVADCTGHGVPGALMSMIGNGLLNEIILRKHITAPNLILDGLRLGIIDALQQGGEEGQTRDAMDIAVCRIDKDSGVLDYAGANNQVYIARRGEMIELKPDKFPAGLQGEELVPFRMISENLFPDDWIYLFSDGYMDQFGGPNGKKLKSKHFKSVLQLLKGSGPDRKKVIEVEFDNWKGELGQVDDVVVVGVRVI